MFIQREREVIHKLLVSDALYFMQISTQSFHLRCTGCFVEAGYHKDPVSFGGLLRMIPQLEVPCLM